MPTLTTTKNINSMMSVFNALFVKDVDLAYDFLKQELRTLKQDDSSVPIKLANGQQVYVNIGLQAQKLTTRV